MRYLILAISVAAGSAGAQPMYRCGSTISDRPCGPGAVQLNAPGPVQAPPIAQLPPTRPADPAKSAEIARQCREWLTAVPGWRDRESVRVGRVLRDKAEWRTVKGRPQVVYSYLTTVSARNGFDGYSGERSAACYANESETTIVDIWLPDM